MMCCTYLPKCTESVTKKKKGSQGSGLTFCKYTINDYTFMTTESNLFFLKQTCVKYIFCRMIARRRVTVNDISIHIHQDALNVEQQDIIPANNIRPSEGTKDIWAMD